jgi:DNA helicase-2/ATP-dependent DNA helicase PcrA
MPDVPVPITTTSNELGAVSEGKAPAATAVKVLVKAREDGVPFFGEPTQNWLSAGDVLAKISGLDDIFAEARMMRLFRARDEVGGTLAASSRAGRGRVRRRTARG